MFFVYDSKNRKIQEYKDLSSVLESYEKNSSKDDLFWTLGLKSWIVITEALTENVLKKKKFQIPALPADLLMAIEETRVTAEAENGIVTLESTPPESAPSPDPAEPKVPPPISNYQQSDDFKIVSYENETVAAIPPKSAGRENQRKSPRYGIRLKVIISNKEKTFLSYTKNVSIGGVALEDNIPAEYFAPDKDTEIFISSPKKNEFLAFRCTPVGDQSDPKNFSFGQISPESLQKFQLWIDNLKAP
ncbi:MAG: PilZ domain-containing protein [Bdellovibrionales bacterium]